VNQVALSFSSLSPATLTLYVMINPHLEQQIKLIQTLMRFGKDVNVLKKDGEKISVCSKEQQQQSFFHILRNSSPQYVHKPTRLVCLTLYPSSFFFSYHTLNCTETLLE